MASDTVQRILAAMPLEPFMAWDAIICTSVAARAVADRVMEAAEAQLRWQTRSEVALPRPMLPIIPLGVHCEDYAFTDADRTAARAELGLASDTVAFLSPGRISLNAKAHPFALMTGLQAAAKRTGKPLALIFAGQAEAEETLRLFERCAADLCPDVRAIFVDGGDPARFRRTWAGADVFVSLSDNIQETFGLTPIEAMAAGLPALVSDWDGYKDTVRDGVDGFRVTTWAPPPGAGQKIGFDYQSGEIAYGTYVARTSLAVAVDLDELGARLDALITDGDLRRRLGAAGQIRARETFDWAVVYRQYQALWAEQDAIRRRALADPATAAWVERSPHRSADHMGPFDAFEGFATHAVTATTQVALGAVVSGGPSPGEAYRALVAHESLEHWRVAPEVFDNLARCLAEGPLSAEALAAKSGIRPLPASEAVARLAKLGVLTLKP
jgi:glycosyltransferase involved in cell wall biosynthesis